MKRVVSFFLSFSACAFFGGDAIRCANTRYPGGIDEGEAMDVEEDDD